MQRHAGCLGRASSRPSCSGLHVPHVPGKSENELIWCLNVLCFFRRSLIQNYFPHKMHRKRIDLVLRCNMLPQLLVDSKSFSTQCTNNLYQKCISIFRTCGSKSRRRDLLGSIIARGRKARYLKVIETPSVCNILLEQSLSFCELRVCLDAPCLANDPSSKNERVSSTAGV